MPSAITASRPAPEVEEAIRRHQQAMNNSRYIPETPDIYREASQRAKVYIFNVGPWSHKRELGSAGTFFIPACPEGSEYSDPLVIPGVAEEPYPINEAECKVIPTPGRMLAEQILGIGPHIAHRSSFVQFGVFISETPKPAREELAKAREILKQKHMDIVGEANKEFAKGHNIAVEQPEWYFVSARALKKTAAECPWLKDSVIPAERNNCPSCNEIYTVGQMKCKCGFILDKKRYDAAVKEGLFAS